MKPVRIYRSLYASPMPRPWEIEEVVEEFDAIVSLATPVEHAWEGYDPRTLPKGLRFYWLPVPPYNAPYVNRLAETVGRILDWLNRGLRVLIHSWRGCARTAMVASAVVAVDRGSSYLEALSEVSARLGCGVETLVQVQAVRGLRACLRLGLALEDVAELHDRLAAVCEYAATLASELSAYTGIDWTKLSKTVSGGGAEGLEGDVASVAGLLASKLDYTVVWINAGSRGLRLDVWVPRGMHPQVAPPPRRLSDGSLEELISLWRRIAGRIGLPSTVDTVYHDPSNPPPPRL